MKNSWLSWLVGVLGTLWTVAGVAAEGDLEGRVRMLLEGYVAATEQMDEEAEGRRKELDALGEECQPALIQCFWESDEPRLQAAVLGVFLRSGADSAIVRENVREFLVSGRDARYAVTQEAALQYLGERGTVDDIPLCRWYLQNGDDGVRKQASRTLDSLVGHLPEKVLEEPPRKTYTDYPEWTSFPRGIDCEDEEEVARFQRLVERGEAAHEAMLAIARECDDGFDVSTALAVLRASPGDKRAVVAELKAIFPIRVRGETWNDEIIVLSMADALVAMGQDEDFEVMIPMLFHSRQQVRAVGIMLLGKHGGRKTLEALKKARVRISGTRRREAIDAAISGIEIRLAETECATRGYERP